MLLTSAAGPWVPARGAPVRSGRDPEPSPSTLGPIFGPSVSRGCRGEGSLPADRPAPSNRRKRRPSCTRSGIPRPRGRLQGGGRFRRRACDCLRFWHDTSEKLRSKGASRVRAAGSGQPLVVDHGRVDTAVRAAALCLVVDHGRVDTAVRAAALCLSGAEKKNPLRCYDDYLTVPRSRPRREGTPRPRPSARLGRGPSWHRWPAAWRTSPLPRLRQPQTARALSWMFV